MIRGERRSDGTTGTRAHDAIHAIRAVQCRDLWVLGTGGSALLLVASLLSMHGPRAGQDWFGIIQGRLGAAHPDLRSPRVPRVGNGSQIDRRVLV